MKKMILAALLASAVLVSGTAFAQDGGDGAGDGAGKMKHRRRHKVKRHIKKHRRHKAAADDAGAGDSGK